MPRDHYKLNKCEIKSYKDHILKWRNEWRNNPDEYSLEKDNLVLNGYTSLLESYDLSETEFSWVEFYIISPYITSRISNEVQIGSTFGGELTFDYTDDNIGLIKGKGWWSPFDGVHYYVKDEDFEKLTFPDLPTESIPDYIYYKEYCDCPEKEKFLDDNPEFKEFIKNVKIGQQLFTGIPGKFVTILDIKNGNIILNE